VSAGVKAYIAFLILWLSALAYGIDRAEDPFLSASALNRRDRTLSTIPNRWISAAILFALTLASGNARAVDPFEFAPGPPAAVARPAPHPALRPRAVPAPPEVEATPPQPHVASAPIPAPLPSYDGDYVGTIRLLTDATAGQRGAFPGSNSGRLARCSSDPLEKALTIRNGQFSFGYHDELGVNIAGSIASDGSVAAFISSASGGVKITARVAGNDLIGTVGNTYCVYMLQFRKQAGR